MAFTLTVVGTARDMPAGAEEPYQYDVLGLPTLHEASIAKLDGAWQVLRIVDGQMGEWQGRFATAEDALHAIEEEWRDDATALTIDDIPAGDWVLLRATSHDAMGLRRETYALNQQGNAGGLEGLGRSRDDLRDALLIRAATDRVDAWLVKGRLVRRLAAYRQR